MRKFSVALILALRLLVVTSTVAQAAAPLLASGPSSAVAQAAAPLLASGPSSAAARNGAAVPAVETPATLQAAAPLLPSSTGGMAAQSQIATSATAGISAQANGSERVRAAGNLAQEAPPPLPSSFYGTVMLDGAVAPLGTLVSAWINGVKYAQAATTSSGGDVVFVLDMPGDSLATPQNEGGREGQPIIFRVGGYAAGQIGLWRSGTVTELNLTAIAWDGPDLVLLKDNGQTMAASGEVLIYTLAVVNVGNSGATGVALADTLPAHVAFVAASDGGSEAGGIVTWPAFNLATGESVARTVTVRTEEPLPAGVGRITNTATVADDGASGPDPTPGNNAASDVDAVTAAADLAFNGERLTQCAPGRVVLPPAMDFLVASAQEVEQGCESGALSAGAHNRLASAVRALVNEFIDNPAITAAYDLNGTADAIESHTGCADLASDLEALRVIFVNLRLQTCAIAHHGVSAVLTPGATYTLVNRPVTYTLTIANQGTLETTYGVQIGESANLQISILQPPISNFQLPFTVTLSPGDTFSATLIVTPTAVGNFTLRADVAAQEAPIVQAQATAALRGLDAYLDLVAVGANPAFVEYASGTPAALYARIANLTQAPLEGEAHTRVWDAAGTPVFTTTRTLQFESALLPLQYDLGALDTGSLITGVYTITLEVLDANGDVIPRTYSPPPPAGEGPGVGAYGLLAVGQAIRASSSVAPAVVPPGNVTVTTVITTELIHIEEPEESGYNPVGPAMAQPPSSNFQPPFSNFQLPASILQSPSIRPCGLAAMPASSVPTPLVSGVEPTPVSVAALPAKPSDISPSSIFHFLTSNLQSPISICPAAFQQQGQSPLAAFSAEPTAGIVPLAVQFWDESTPEGEITAWEWDFGDGETSDQEDPLHTYTEPGEYDVSLTVWANGQSDTLTQPSYVEVQGAPGCGTLFQDNFDDNSLGPAWTTWNGTWSEADGVLSQTSASQGDPSKAIVSNPAAAFPSDLVITARVRVDSWTDGDSARAGVSLFTNTGDGAGYNLLFHANHSTVQFLDDYVAWGPSYTFNWSTATWYWFKLKMEDGSLYGKVWQDGSAEPAEWPYVWNHSGRSGYPALNGGSSGGTGSVTVSFDDMSVTAPTGPILLSPADAEGRGRPGTTVAYTVTLANRTGAADDFTLTLSGNTWPAALSVDHTGTVLDGEAIDFTVQVEVPPGAVPGTSDEVTITATSVSNPDLCPAAVAISTVALSGQHSYVFDPDSNAIRVVDTVFHEDTGTFIDTGLYGAWEGALSPDGLWLYASLRDGGAVLVVDTATDSPVTSIPVGDQPAGVAFSADGAYAFVANSGSGSVSVIDTSALAVIATIPVGDGPQSIATTPCLGQVYVTNAWGDSVSVIDAEILAVTQEIGELNGPRDIVISPYGHRAYVSNNYGAIGVIDTINDSLLATWDVGGYTLAGLDLSPDGRTLYVADYDPGGGGGYTTYAVDTRTGQVIAAIPTQGAWEVEVFPAEVGPLAYVSRPDYGEIAVIDVGDNSEVGAIALGGQPFGLALFPPSTTCLHDVFLDLPATAGFGETGAARVYTATLLNLTGANDSFTLTLSGNAWPAALLVNPTAPIPYGATGDFTVQVDVPGDALPGASDVVTVTAISVLDPAVYSATATITTTALSDRRGYVFNPGNNAIDVVDTLLHVDTGQSIDTGPYGSWPERGALSPDGRWLYVSLRDSASVLVIDTATNTPVTTIPVGSGPRGVAFTGDSSRAFVANMYDGSVSVIDTDAPGVIATIQVGDGPQSIAMAPCLGKAYVTNRWGGGVSVIDLGTLTVTKVITGLNSPEDIVISRPDYRAYVSNQWDGSIGVIDVTDDSLIATWDIGAWWLQGLALSPDGSTLYAADPNRGVTYAVATSSGEVTAIIPTGDSSWGVEVFPSSAGPLAYVSTRWNGNVAVVDIGTNEVVGTISLGGGVYGLALFPLEPDFCLSVADEALAICSPGSDSTTVSLTVEGAYTRAVTLSADGLPTQASADFSVNPLAVPGDSVMTVAIAEALVGDYEPTVGGTDGAVTHAAGLALSVFDAVPGTPDLLSPADEAAGQPLAPTFTWAPVAQTAAYHLEIATDAAFSDVVYAATVAGVGHVPSDVLDVVTQYYWRVWADNACGVSGYPTPFRFTTSGPADPSNSTVTISPARVVADGVQAATITVTLRDALGYPIPNREVELSVSGSNNALTPDDQAVTDVQGNAVFQLTSTTAETKQVSVRDVLYDVTLPDATVVFALGAHTQLQVLLPGETSAPGVWPGKTGSPDDAVVWRPFTFTVQAVDATWNLVPTVTDTVGLTSTDGLALLPSSVQLEEGVAVVSVTFATVGLHTIGAADLSDAGIAGDTSAPFRVKADAAVRLALSLSSPVEFMTPADALVVAYDAYDNVATDYTGTIGFASSDRLAALPGDYTFTSGVGQDNGTHTFAGGVIFRTAGPQWISVTDLAAPTLVATATVALPADVIVDEDTTWSAEVIVVGNLIVTNSATLTMTGATTITAMNVSVAEGAAISADRQGYGGGSGPEAGTSGCGSYVGGGGGGHGGWGGRSEGGSPGGAPYDDVYRPQVPGSGGGNNCGYYGGAGGGAMHLVVSDTLMLLGVLSASGEKGGNTTYADTGGGAGGSIWIETGLISGSGNIQANGGDGGWWWYYYRGNNSGGGAGGRIAIYADTYAFSGTLQVQGGSAGSSYAGQSGTVYLGRVDPVSSTVVALPPTGNVVSELQGATITVTLVATAGLPVAAEPVSLKVLAGTHCFVNGQSAAWGESVPVSATGPAGVVTATVASTRPETVTVEAWAGPANQALRLLQTADVGFVVGPPDAGKSALSAWPPEVVADGVTTATVSVLVRDAYDNPLPGITVTLYSAGPGAMFTQPDPTDVTGRTSGAVASTRAGLVTVSAIAADVPISGTTTVHFLGPDLVVTQDAAGLGTAGYPVTCTIHLQNQGWTPAASVVLTNTLPQHVDYLTYTASIPLASPSQGGAGGGLGQTLAWQVGDLVVGDVVTVEVVGVVSDTAPLDAWLANQAEVASTTAEENFSNNVFTASIQVKPGYRFDAWLEPAAITTTIGAPAVYRVKVQNAGTLADAYSLALSGIGPNEAAWYTLEPVTLTLPAGAVGEALLTALVTDCAQIGTYTFDVHVVAAGNGAEESPEGVLTLQSAPIIANLTPGDGVTLGSDDVLFAWTTNVSATTSLFIRPQGTGDYTEYSGAGGKSHSVIVENLPRNVAYDWTVRSESVCGIAQSAGRTLTIGNGLVFAPHEYAFTIDRDYGQQRSVTVSNTDQTSHTLLLTIEVPTEDLIVGFIGSGSADQVVTLGPAGSPNDSRDVILAIHAQDAQPNATYNLVAHLTADDEGAQPIVDYASIQVTIFVANADFTLEQTGFYTDTLVRTFRVTNIGNVPLTDLAVNNEVLSGSGALLIVPSLDHAYLLIGQSLDFSVVPMLDENFESLTARLVASAAGAARTAMFGVACEAGCRARLGRVENVMLEARNGGNYCSNRPDIATTIDLPGGFRRANVASVELRVTIRPNYGWFRNILPHDAEFFVNGHKVGGYYDVIPNGVYTFLVDPAYLNETMAGVSRNTVEVHTRHMNGGHYVVLSDLALSVCLTEYEEWVCAADQPQADEIVASRSYLVPAADAITTHILEPRDGQRILVGSTLQVSAWVTDSLSSGRVYAVIASSGNDNGGLMLYDDGRHGDGAAMDGVYANTWTPLNPGLTALTVAAGNCHIVGSATITVEVLTSQAQVDLAHRVPLSGVVVVESTFSHPPLATMPGAEEVTYDWAYVLSPTLRTRVTTFDVALPAMQPGEVRRVAAGSVVSYTTAGGHGEATLPPLYVAAAHLIAIDPPVRTTNPGGRVTYAVTLYNPQETDDVFNPALEGLPSGWASAPISVPIAAGVQALVPVTVTVPVDAALGDCDFAATVETSSGGRDTAQARLAVAELLEVAIAPPLLSAGNGETVTYTLTITNLESVERTYELQIADCGLQVCDLPSTVTVGANDTATTTLRITAWAPRGLYLFEVTTAYETPEHQVADLQTCTLAISSDLGVAVGLDPNVATGGRGTSAVYTLTITNTGSLADTYDLAVGVPAGWDAEISANGTPLDEITLTPYVFNVAALQLVVVPAESASDGPHTFAVTATSRADPGTQAGITGTTDVSLRGVTVQIAPHTTTMEPSGTRTWDVTVRNTSPGQDTFDLTAGGIVAATAQFSPTNPVTVNAGQSAVVQMTAGPFEFALPQSYPFAVTARSQGDPQVFNADTAEVTFTSFEDVAVSLLPASLTVTDTLEAAYLVVITNTGNVDTVYTLAASSAPTLGLDLETDEVYIPPHMAAGILLTVHSDTAVTRDYAITVQVDSTGGAASASASAGLTIVITNKPPQANAGPDQTVSEGEAVHFSGAFSDPNPEDTHTIAWDFGDGATTSGTLTPTHTYADDAPGGDVYTATLTVADDEGVWDSDTLLVTVLNVAPAVDAGPDQTADEGEAVHFGGAFTDPGVLDTHTVAWDFGDGMTATATLTPAHTYADDGVYTVTLSVTDSGGEVGNDTLVVSVVNVAPTVDAGPDHTANEGAEVYMVGAFSDPGTLDTHTIAWDFGDGATINGTLNPTHTYADDAPGGGVYTVTLTVTDDDDGVGSDTRTVTVHNLAPAVDAGPDQTADEGATVAFAGAFSDPGTLDTHTIAWDFGDGESVTGTLNPTHVYVDDAPGGFYTVTLTVTDDDGGAGSDTLVVTVLNVAPIVDAGPDQAVNRGEVAHFGGAFADPGVLDTHAFVWDFGDGATTGGTLTPTHVYTSAGVYTVTLTVTDDDGGMGSDALVVTVGGAIPVVDAGPDQTADEGEVVQFAGSLTDFDPADADSIEWDFGDGATAGGTLTPTHTYADDAPGGGIYAVSLTVTDDGGVIGSDTLLVTVNNVAPEVDAGPDRVVDEGTMVYMVGSFGDPGTLDTHTIVWDLGDGETITGTLNPAHAYADEAPGGGVYTVTLTVTDDDGGVGSDIRTVTVHNVAPAVSAWVTPAVSLPRQAVTFTGAFSDPGWLDSHTIVWDLGDGTVVTGGLSTSHAYALGGVYTVTLTVSDDDGGTGQAVVVLGVCCELYPIALHVDTLDGVAVGQEMEDIYNGGGPGNFGWLSWTGHPSVPTLVHSLTPPGDSNTYVNPYDAGDHVLSVGDWVYGKPGVSNASSVRNALDILKNYVISVPVWDTATGSGCNLKYHVVGFARIQITDYHLPGQNRISAIFWGVTSCPEQ